MRTGSSSAGSMVLSDSLSWCCLTEFENSGGSDGKREIYASLCSNENLQFQLQQFTNAKS